MSATPIRSLFAPVPHFRSALRLPPSLDSGAFVVSSPEYGVLLGLTEESDMIWSANGGQGRDSAFTFTPDQLAYFIAGQDVRDEFEIHRVTPDRPDGSASLEACVAAGVQAWLDAETETYNYRPM